MSEAGARILMIDDEPDVLAGLEMILSQREYLVKGVTSGDEALELLEVEPFDLVITDLKMPGIHGAEFVGLLVHRWPETPVVVLTGMGAVSTAVEMMQLGAADYLSKPVDPSELLIRIQRSLADRAMREESRRLKAMLREETGYGGMVGRDSKLREIFEVIEKVGGAPTPVLIEGEPGTGKELVARAIHARRLRVIEERLGRPPEAASHPFLAINCGAIAPDLVESTLFGHKKGAFTGAIRDSEGVFVGARRGTLFLDEITELALPLQVKLLRALQQREVTPVGSNEAIAVEARIVTATNRPIYELVKLHEFRADLYWRINVVQVRMPALRERSTDIPLLCTHFLETTAELYGDSVKDLAPDVLDVFRSYSWPGNVRQLQNVIERAHAMGDGDRIELSDIDEDSLSLSSVERPGSHVAPGGWGGGDSTAHLGAFLTLEGVIRQHLIEALDRSGWVKTRAAKLLGIHRNRLARLMERHAVESPGSDRIRSELPRRSRGDQHREA